MPARNDPCACGSGKRYKHCHGANSPAVAATAEPAANVEPALVARLREAARRAPPDSADDAWQQLLTEQPGDSEALFNLGNLARHRAMFDAAARHYESALESTSDHVGLLNNLGLVYEKLGRLDDAEARFRHALRITPDGMQPLANLAQNLFQQHRYVDAIEYFDRLVAQYPKMTQASMHGNRGVCLAIVGRLEDADAALSTAMELDPGLAVLSLSRGHLLSQRGDWSGAQPMLEAALALDPDNMYIASSLAHCRGHTADWSDGGAIVQRILARMRDTAGTAAIYVSPLDILAQVDDPDLQRIATRYWAPRQVDARPAFDADRKRLHLGFVSSDFCNHPVPRLLLGLAEKLDRSRFETTAIAIAEQRFDDTFLQRSRRAFDHFVEIDRRSTPAEVAMRVRALGIDVLFDLNGITNGAMVALFGHRAAPMQVNFIGYTASIDSTAYDYIIADSYCIPAQIPSHCTERVLRLDPCYLPSDAARTLADPAPTRAQYLLPDNAFVLAMFGAPYKIRSDMFARWMSLMRADPASVLWLRPVQPLTITNLRRRAETLGVAGSRLILAPEERAPAYLARFRLADLVLDTFPFGSHTTVNDALFAGAPVLTITGRSFAARASASQLASMGLTELIARDGDDYTRIAGELIANRDRLAELTARVRSDDARRGLFDMDRYAKSFAELIFAGWRDLASTRRDN